MVSHGYRGVAAQIACVCMYVSSIFLPAVGLPGLGLPRVNGTSCAGRRTAVSLMQPIIFLGKVGGNLREVTFRDSAASAGARRILKLEGGALSAHRSADLSFACQGELDSGEISPTVFFFGCGK